MVWAPPRVMPSHQVASVLAKGDVAMAMASRLDLKCFVRGYNRRRGRTFRSQKLSCCHASRLSKPRSPPPIYDPCSNFCIPITGKVVPTGAEWFHEIKYDGYACVLESDCDHVRLITRGGHDWTRHFPWIVRNRRWLPLPSQFGTLGSDRRAC